MSPLAAMVGAFLGVVVTSHLHRTAGFWARRVGHSQLRRANLPVGGALALALAFAVPQDLVEPLLAAAGTMAVTATGGVLFDPLPPWQPSRHGTPARWVTDAMDALGLGDLAVDRIIVWAPDHAQARIMFDKLAEAARERGFRIAAGVLRIVGPSGATLHVLPRGSTRRFDDRATLEIEPYPHA